MKPISCCLHPREPKIWPIRRPSSNRNRRNNHLPPATSFCPTPNKTTTKASRLQKMPNEPPSRRRRLTMPTTMQLVCALLDFPTLAILSCCRADVVLRHSSLREVRRLPSLPTPRMPPRSVSTPPKSRECPRPFLRPRVQQPPPRHRHNPSA